MLRRWAETTVSELMKPFENFLDDNEEKLSPELWDMLHELCDELDRKAKELEENLEEANNDIDALNDRITELENEK